MAKRSAWLPVSAARRRSDEGVVATAMCVEWEWLQLTAHAAMLCGPGVSRGTRRSRLHVAWIQVGVCPRKKRCASGQL